MVVEWSRPATPVPANDTSIAAVPKLSSDDDFFGCAFCSLALAFKVIARKPNQINDIEHSAIESTVKQNKGSLLEAVLAGVFDRHTNNLAGIADEKFPSTCIALSRVKNFSDAVKQLFLAYTHAVRLELTNAK